MKPLKQALVTELAAALSTVLPVTSTGTLPKGVAQAVEELADSILRWRASQQRTLRGSSKAPSSESDELSRLMQGRLYEEESVSIPDAPPVPPALAPASPTAQLPAERKRRPRIPR
ncbi:hypothetical protein [Hymenobacter swuensis]|uniref:Uncharacterized protein n=1 Tax=Hymenobacter swuensis DY53 TaxID=1227739 RepID=W8EQ44_9BACT|nr:hypothetical protein [Hymenobacter swuensis]AHJ95294.1 hypothetical protein Hsw_PB0004 [Hymenobacter swuensis DY53]